MLMEEIIPRIFHKRKMGLQRSRGIDIQISS